MATATAAPAAGALPRSEATWLGHPRGLFVLFMTETWERMSYYGMRTLLTLYMPLWILVNGKVSWGQVMVGYLGLLLLGAACISIGLFASSLARSQVVAAILGGGILAVFLLLWMVANVVEAPLNGVLSRLALHHENYRPFMQGVLDLRGVVYYLVFSYFFLLAATKTLEARRWR